MADKKQLKLYFGGCGRYEDFTVANSEEKAKKNIGNQLNIQALPIEVKEIRIEGYKISIEPIE